MESFIFQIIFSAVYFISLRKIPSFHFYLLMTLLSYKPVIEQFQLNKTLIQGRFIGYVSLIFGIQFALK